MEFLNVGLGEIVVIVIIALLVFGPERLPEVARRAARMVGEVRKVANEVQRTFMEESGVDDIRKPLNDIKSDLTSVSDPIRDLKQETTSIRSDILKPPTPAVKEAHAAPAPASANGTTGDANRPYKPLSSGDSQDS